MALDITNPQTITSGEGTGFAKVIPLEKFQAADTKNLIDHQWDKFQLEKQKQEKLKSNLASLPKAVVAKEEKNRKEIADDYNSFLDFSVNLAAQGIDLTSNPEFMKREQQLKQKVALDEMMAKKLGEYKSELEKNGTKYDQDYFNQRLNEYLEAPSIEERTALMNKPWLLENIEPLDGLKGFFPEVQGYGAVTNDQANQGAKLFYMEKKPIMEAAIERGIYKDEEDALAKISEAIKLLAPYKNPPKSGGGSTFNFGGEGNVTLGGANATYEPAQGFNSANPNATNYVQLTIKPTSLITSKGGTPIWFQADGVKLKEGTTDQWVVMGREAKRMSVSEFARAKNNDSFNEEDFTFDPNEQVYISIRQSEPMELPISFDPNKVGYSNLAALNKAGKTDIKRVIEARNKEIFGTSDWNQIYKSTGAQSGLPPFMMGGGTQSNQAPKIGLGNRNTQQVKSGLKPTGNL